MRRTPLGSVIPVGVLSSAEGDMQFARSVRRSFVPGLLSLALGGCAVYDEAPQPIKDPHYIAFQQQTTDGDVQTVRVEVSDPHLVQ
jgi:hypothetical protein